MSVYSVEFEIQPVLRGGALFAWHIGEGGVQTLDRYDKGKPAAFFRLCFQFYRVVFYKYTGSANSICDTVYAGGFFGLRTYRMYGICCRTCGLTKKL